MNSPRPRGFLLPALTATAVLLAFPASADAHLAIKGAGDFGNGALHPLVTPLHVMIALGLALLLGMRTPLRMKAPMISLAASSAIALAIASTQRFEPPATVLTILAMLIGMMVAIGRSLPPGLLAGICAVCAVAVGLDSGVDPDSGMVVSKTLVGTWLGLNGLIGYLALAVSNGAEKPWARTGMRILGSWIFAISVLMLAFALKGKRHEEKAPPTTSESNLK